MERVWLPTLVTPSLYQADVSAFLQQHFALQGGEPWIGGIRIGSWLFYHHQFPRWPRSRHGRSKSEVRNRPEAYSLAGLGWAGLGRAGQEHGWGRYLNTFYKIEI
ncbi:hypothetical protein A9G04_13135 [Aeromonas sp. ANNP30]|nr:hypothetical protein A9G04_13135 [Aeromonas sp. ANNP30]